MKIKKTFRKYNKHFNYSVNLDKIKAEMFDFIKDNKIIDL